MFCFILKSAPQPPVICSHQGQAFLQIFHSLFPNRRKWQHQIILPFILFFLLIFEKSHSGIGCFGGGDKEGRSWGNRHWNYSSKNKTGHITCSISFFSPLSSWNRLRNLWDLLSHPFSNFSLALSDIQHSSHFSCSIAVETQLLSFFKKKQVIHTIVIIRRVII